MKIRRAHGVLVLGLALALGAYMVVKPRLGSASVVLLPNDARLLALGAAVYGARCAACHGAKLEGQPEWRSRGPDGLLPAPPHDESGHTWHHADDLLFRITKFGVGAAINDRGYKSSMPAFAGVLSDEEIIAVLSWIKSRWPPEVRAHNDEINAPLNKQGR
jgi:mono/diheme cytochrome c family protein